MTGTERAVAEIWRELLEAPDITPDDDFFLLGGRSMTAMHVVTRVRAQLGVRVGLADVLRRPVLRELAELVDERAAERAAAPGSATS